MEPTGTEAAVEEAVEAAALVAVVAVDAAVEEAVEAAVSGSNQKRTRWSVRGKSLLAWIMRYPMCSGRACATSATSPSNCHGNQDILFFCFLAWSFAHACGSINKT